MSFRAYRWAIEQDIDDPLAKFVLIALADAYNDATGRCFPKISQIKKCTRLSDRSIQRKIGDLAEAGFLSVRSTLNPDTGRQLANEYVLHFDQINAAGLDQEEDETDADGCQTVTHMGDTQSPHGCQTVTHGVTQGHPMGDCVSGLIRNQEESQEVEPREKGKRTAIAIPPTMITEGFEVWNAMASAAGLATVRVRTPGRVRAMSSVLRAHGMDGWQRICDLVRADGFLTGANDRDWRADFDFVVKPAKVVKILEGGWSRAKGGGSVLPPAEVPRATWERRFGQWRKSGWWDANAFGPAPGQPGCRVPVDLLADNSGRREAQAS